MATNTFYGRNDDVDVIQELPFDDEETMLETDYFKIIDRKLEKEKLKKKNKHATSANNGHVDTTTDNVNHVSATNSRMDNFKAKHTALTWEISPTIRHSSNENTGLSKFKYNTDRHVNEYAQRIDRNTHDADDDDDDDKDEDVVQSKEKLFTYHRYKCVIF